MAPQYYLVLHLVSLLLLAGVTFAALAAPQPERRKFSLMWSGILSLVVLVSGFGLLARLGLPFQGWVSVKLVCWVALAMMTPMAFRRSAQGAVWSRVTIAALVIGVLMVQLKPF